jgi:hypothetical protein
LVLGTAVRAAGSLGVTYNEVKLSLDPSVIEGTAAMANELFDLVELVVDKGSERAVLLLDQAQVVRDERVVAVSTRCRCSSRLSPHCSARSFPSAAGHGLL